MKAAREYGACTSIYSFLQLQNHCNPNLTSLFKNLFCSPTPDSSGNSTADWVAINMAKINYKQWPFLSEEEFELACTYLEQRYKKANSEQGRFTFKLSTRQIASTGLSYVQILRLLQPPEDINELSLAFERLSAIDYPCYECDTNSDLMNEIDEEELCPSGQPPKYSLRLSDPYVIYEIHLHPTYRVPTLWFTLHDLPKNEDVLNVETVYRYIVPPQYQLELRLAGITGGFSAAPHPVTYVPTFFIHPCQTKEALEDFDCLIEDYLIVWIGIVGGSVGLWIPHEMANTN